MTAPVIETPSSAPAAPQPPVTAPATTSTAPGIGTPIQQAMARAREQIAQGQGIAAVLAGKEGAPAADEAAPAAEGVPAGATRGADGVWRNPDGTFAAVPAEAATDVSEPGSEGETGPVVVALPPRNEGEPEVEIEVSDPAVAERLRELRNNGLRRVKYDQAMAEIEQQRSEFNEFISVLREAPEAIIDRMPAENRARVLRYLLASDLDTHRDYVAGVYNDDATRRLELAAMKEQQGQQMHIAQSRTAAERKADLIRREIRTLIPETAADGDAQDFYADAESFLARIAHERGDLDPREVATLLAARVARYWGGNGTQQRAPLGEARPVGPTAEAVAKKAATARAHVARVQAAQQTRQVAAKVAPQGAGAVPTTTPTPPPGQNLKERLAWFKQNLPFTR